MSNSYVIEEWDGVKELFRGTDFVETCEAQAAKELIEAKEYIPASLLRESGLDRFESAKALQDNEEKLIEIAAFFSDQSISSKTEPGDDGLMCYEAHMNNTSLFFAVLIIDFAATLYHITFGMPLNVKVILDNEKNVERMKKIFGMVAEKFEDVQSFTIDGDKDTGEAGEGKTDSKDGNPYEDSWTKDLNEIVEQFAGCRSAKSFSEILRMMLEGAACYVDAQFPENMQEDAASDDLSNLTRLVSTENEPYLVLLTKPCDRFQVTASKKLLEVFPEFKDESLKGIVINPYEENIVIDRDFIISAIRLFSAGIHFSERKADKDASEDSHPDAENDRNTLKTARPMTEPEFELVEDAIRHLEHENIDSFFILEFENYVDGDSVMYMQTKSWGKGYRVEIAFDMSEFNLDKPLILAADNVSLKDTLDIFRRIGLTGETTDKVKYILKNFREAGAHKENK